MPTQQKRATSPKLDLATRARDAYLAHISAKHVEDLRTWLAARHITPDNISALDANPYACAARVDNRWGFEINGVLSVECMDCGWVRPLDNEDEHALLLLLGKHVEACDPDADGEDDDDDDDEEEDH